MLIRDVTLTDPPVVVEAEAAGAYELLIELSVLTGEGPAATIDPADDR
jgi:hypothetical protein